MEKLGRVFFFGIAYAVMLAGMGVGIWALCRLVGMGLEFLRTGKVKKPDRTLSKHPLGGASLRAKASWLVCCLEEALLAGGLEPYPDQPGDCPWHPLLALLWQVAELPAPLVDRKWLEEAMGWLPSEVLTPYPHPERSQGSGEAERFAAAWALYTRAGYRMAYLAPLVELPVRLVRDCWDDPTARAGDILALLEEARWLLENYNIPLPPRDRVEFLAKQKDIGPGDPFVGRQCSYFVAW